MIGKEVKAEKVIALHNKFVDVKGAILSDFRGLTVQQMAELRNQLREAAVKLQVVKNTLAKRAVEETPLVSLEEYFAGPTAVAHTVSDVMAMAKVLTEYAKKEPKLDIRVGLIEGQVLSPQQITAVADLPPREILLGRMLASVQSPLSGLVGVLQGVLRQLLYVFAAVKEAKKQADS